MRRIFVDILTSRWTLSVLLGLVLVVGMWRNTAVPELNGELRSPAATTNALVPQAKRSKNLFDYVLTEGAHSDATKRLEAVQTREELAIKRRFLDKDDGGGGGGETSVAAAARRSSPKGLIKTMTATRHPVAAVDHVHVVVVGDSLSEGVMRAKEATTKLLYRPYVVSMMQELCREGGLGVGIGIGCSYEIHAFRGKTAGGIFHEMRERLFNTSSAASSIESANHDGFVHFPLKNDPDVSSATSPPVSTNQSAVRLRDLLRTSSSLPADAAAGGGGVSSKPPLTRLTVVCSVLAGTNDMLRAPGSTVASSLTPITTDHAVTNILKLHQLCAAYVEANVLSSHSRRLARIKMLLVPVSLPPAMLRKSTLVHQRLVQSLRGKRNSVAATYGYCMTGDVSVDSMLTFRDGLNRAISSCPGSFCDRLNIIAKQSQQRLTAARSLVGAAAASKAVVEVLPAKTPVVFPDALLADDLSMWSDCLHLTSVSYRLMGEHIARHVRAELFG